mgnify:CR=1 FL=1
MKTELASGEGDLLWQPTPAQSDATRLAAYQRWLAAERGVQLPDYAALWQWSVDDIERFWESIWDFFDVQADGSRQPVLASKAMPGAHDRLGDGMAARPCGIAERAPGAEQPQAVARRGGAGEQGQRDNQEGGANRRHRAVLGTWRGPVEELPVVRCSYLLLRASCLGNEVGQIRGGRGRAIRAWGSARRAGATGT